MGIHYQVTPEDLAKLRKENEMTQENKISDGFQTFGSSTLVDNVTSLRIYVNEAEVFEFKQLLFRGINNSPDASPAMKTLYDLITHGRPLQDYAQQDAPMGSKKTN